MPTLAAEEAAILQTITSEVGETDTGVLSTMLTILWTSFADKALIAPRLQELYTRRSAIDLVMAELRQTADVATPGNVQEKQSQWMTNLRDMRQAVQTEIDRVERRARATRTPVTGLLQAITPETPYWTGAADPSDPRYRGDLDADPFGVQPIPPA